MKTQQGRHTLQVLTRLSLALAVIITAACSAGSDTANSSGADPVAGCDGNCALSETLGADGARLTIDDVSRILAQGIQEAQARSVNATLAVVDRVGNVLGVFRMGGQRERTVLIASRFTDADGIIDAGFDQSFAVAGGLEGIKLPNPDRSLNEDGSPKWRSTGQCKPGSPGCHRQGNHGCLSVLGRHGFHLAHGQPDSSGTFQSG